MEIVEYMQFRTEQKAIHVHSFNSCWTKAIHEHSIISSQNKGYICLSKSDCLGCAVLLCLVVCVTLLASFFLPSLISH